MANTADDSSVFGDLSRLPAALQAGGRRARPSLLSRFEAALPQWMRPLSRSRAGVSASADVAAEASDTAGAAALPLARANERTAVIVSTRGRPAIVAGLVRHLLRQSAPPDHVFVIASREEDIGDLLREGDRVSVHIGRTGSSLQRNDGLTLVGGEFSFIVFFDDDFVPSRFWLERMAAIFRSRPDIVGLTGRLLADGASGAGIAPAAAEAMIELRDARPDDAGAFAIDERIAYGGNVGSNMAVRCSAIAGIAFDENLPLYAWHEDSDFRARLERRGIFARADALWGVHLGHKQGRVSGLTLGYAQIANAVYLARKGTVPKAFLARTAARNVLANTVRSARPEPFIDRRGRLRGNMRAVADLLSGRLTPARILELGQGDDR